MIVLLKPHANSVYTTRYKLAVDKKHAMLVTRNPIRRHSCRMPEDQSPFKGTSKYSITSLPERGDIPHPMHCNYLVTAKPVAH